MTDNAWVYTRSRLLRQLLDGNDIRHLTTKPYRPRTNGKVERFHQTMAREWAYGLSYRSHRERTAALPEGAGNPIRPLSRGRLVLVNESSEHVFAVNTVESDDGL
jgi:transposase InsO family protein